MVFDLLVGEDETITINFVVSRRANGQLEVHSELDAPKGAEPFEKHAVTFRRPNHADEVSIADEAITLVDGRPVIRAAGLRFRRFVTLLKSWTLKDRDGDALPPTANNVGKLHPAIADFVSEQLERELMVG